MKYGILGCIICLLLIGTASAIAVIPAIVKQTIQAPAIASVPVLNTAAITFDSSVQGATVYLDGKLLGADGAHSKTPVTDNTVIAGDHSATFKMDGYQDSVMSFHVDAGKAQTMYAQLQPLLSAGAVRQVLPESTRVQVQITGIQPVIITTTPPTVMTTSPGDKGMSRISPGTTLLQQVGTLDSSGGNGERTLPESQRVPVAAIQPAPANNGFFESIFGGFFNGLFGQSVPKPPVNTSFTGPTIPPGTSFTVDSYKVAHVIEQDATIYIGEENLNVTHALNQARGTTTDAANNAVPGLTAIGWWINPSEIFTTSPTKTINLGAGSRYKSMTVHPSDFVGYPGDWFLLGANGYSPYSTDSVVFHVVDPQMQISVRNAATLTSVGGTTVAKGTQLRFSITRNIAVKNPLGVANYRSPLTSTRDDGFLDILVANPSGTNMTELDVMTSTGVKTTESLRRSCWDSDLIAPDCTPAYTWDTGATYSNGTARYPSGTYTVQVISKLNNMHNNYRNGGMLYTGKTASQKVTFTLM